MLCVSEAGRLTGTLGGGCVEADIRRRACALISARRSELFRLDLDHDYGFDDGMICGGRLDVAVNVMASPSDATMLREVVRQVRSGRAATLSVHAVEGGRPVEYRVAIESPPRLLIAGAGHISRVLAGFAIPLGFRVCVIDDRAEYANERRFPPPIETLVGDIAQALRDGSMDAHTFVVIVTRGHRHDERALAAVLDSPARYIGMIGSRRKVEVIFNDLRAGGADPEQFERVHAPIGVDIHAVTTEEIALSIAAQLVAVRRADHRGVVEGPIPVRQAAP
jgi:xanthine dehydrogenase accessory factor